MTCHIVNHNTHVECPYCKKNTYTIYLCHPRFNTPYHTFCPKCQHGYDCPECTEIQRAKERDCVTAFYCMILFLMILFCFRAMYAYAMKPA